MSYSWIGIWLLVISFVAIVIEGVVAGIWSARVTRQAQLLSERLADEQRLVSTEVERLQMALAETVELWQPFRRLLRWLRHPLVIALMQSYARRRSTAR